MVKNIVALGGNLISTACRAVTNYCRHLFSIRKVAKCSNVKDLDNHLHCLSAKTSEAGEDHACKDLGCSNGSGERSELQRLVEHLPIAALCVFSG